MLRLCFVARKAWKRSNPAMFVSVSERRHSGVKRRLLNATKYTLLALGLDADLYGDTIQKKARPPRSGANEFAARRRLDLKTWGFGHLRAKSHPKSNG